LFDGEPQSLALNRNLLLAPANVAVEYNKEVTTFNGTFEMDSIYRGKPSPELDAAWSRVGIDGIITCYSAKKHLLN
jgi:mycotoxin biosynthesis protein UstYa